MHVAFGNDTHTRWLFRWSMSAMRVISYTCVLILWFFSCQAAVVRASLENIMLWNPRSKLRTTKKSQGKQRNTEKPNPMNQLNKKLAVKYLLRYFDLGSDLETPEIDYIYIYIYTPQMRIGARGWREEGGEKEGGDEKRMRGGEEGGEARWATRDER